MRRCPFLPWAAPSRSLTIRTSRPAFAGIAKAYAIWIPSGPGRGVFLTVAAAGGSALPPGNPTLDNLVTSLHDYGNPLIPIYAAVLPGDTVQPRSRCRLRSAPTTRQTVQAAVLQSLRQSYSFAARDFRPGSFGRRNRRVHSGRAGSDRRECDEAQSCGRPARAGDLTSSELVRLRAITTGFRSRYRSLARAPARRRAFARICRWRTRTRCRYRRRSSCSIPIRRASCWG